MEHFQTVSGLGVNANVHSWENGQAQAGHRQDRRFGDVTWRVIIDKGDWLAREDPSDPGTIDWAGYTPIYEHGKWPDLWDTIDYISSNPASRSW